MPPRRLASPGLSGCRLITGTCLSATHHWNWPVLRPHHLQLSPGEPLKALRGRPRCFRYWLLLGPQRLISRESALPVDLEADRCWCDPRLGMAQRRRDLTAPPRCTTSAPLSTRGTSTSTDLGLDGVDQLVDPDTHELRHLCADLIPPEGLVLEDVEDERQVTVL